MGYFFEGKDRYYISTAQIQMLSNEIVKWARLQEGMAERNEAG